MYELTYPEYSMANSGHFCYNPASDTLEFGFYVLILYFTSSFSCVNNLMHIPANYSCDSWTVLVDMTRDLCIILFTLSVSLLKLSNELFLHLHMCSLLSSLNMCSLYCICGIFVLYWNVNIYFVITHYLFWILRLELHVCIMLTFMFCEINVNIVTRANASVFSNWSDNINRYHLIGAFHLKAHLTPATHLVNNPWTWFHFYF